MVQYLYRVLFISYISIDWHHIHENLSSTFPIYPMLRYGMAQRSVLEVMFRIVFHKNNSSPKMGAKVKQTISNILSTYSSCSFSYVISICRFFILRFKSIVTASFFGEFRKYYILELYQCYGFLVFCLYFFNTSMVICKKYELLTEHSL